MSIQGGFFQVLDYLNRLEDLGRLVIIDALNASAANADDGNGTGTASTTGAPTLAVTLTGRMFTMAAPVAPAGSTPTPGPTSGHGTARRRPRAATPAETPLRRPRR